MAVGNTNQAILRIVGITKRFGSIVANDNATMELYRSEVHGLLGKNSSGKTTWPDKVRLRENL